MADLLRAHVVGLVVATAVCATAPATAQSRPLLTAEGSSSATAVLQLSRPSLVKVDALLSDQVAVSGDGRVVGVVLEQIAAEPRALLVAVSYNLCPEPACAAADRQEFVTGRPTAVGGARPEDVRLPAGRYRLTLLADGRPVKATLALTGLDQPLELRPTGSTEVAYRQVEGLGQQAPAPLKNLFSGGRSYDGEQPSVVLTQQLYRTTAGAAGAGGTCIIRGAAPPAGAYVPGCPSTRPADDRVEFVSPVTALDPASVLVAGFGAVEVPAGTPTSIGHYLASALPVEESSVTHVEVPLGAQLPVPGDTGPATPQASPSQTEQPPAPAPRAGPQLPATGGSAPSAALAALSGLLLLVAWSRRAHRP